MKYRTTVLCLVIIGSISSVQAAEWKAMIAPFSLGPIISVYKYASAKEAEQAALDACNKLNTGDDCGTPVAAPLDSYLGVVYCTNGYDDAYTPAASTKSWDDVLNKGVNSWFEKSMCKIVARM